MSALNVEELRFALKVTEEAAAKGLWDQTYWLHATECGTVGCLAGNYALATGCRMYDMDIDVKYVFDVNDNFMSVSEYAQTNLGLSEDEAAWLFAPANSLDDLRFIVGELILESELVAA